MNTAHDLLHQYLAARGLPMPPGASARKVAEESIELVEACSRDVPDRGHVMHELEDVVLAATVVAEHYGFTLEQAVQAKVAFDTGREPTSTSRGSGTSGVFSGP